MKALYDKIKTMVLAHPYTTISGLIVLICGQLATVEQLAAYSSILNAVAGIVGGLGLVFAGDGSATS